MSTDRYAPGPVETLARLAIQSDRYSTDPEFRVAVDAVLGKLIFDAAPELHTALHACVDALNVAVGFDADVFGGQHNRALDTLSLAHAALAEVTQ